MAFSSLLMKKRETGPQATISLDSTSIGQDVSSGTTLTWSHTCSGTNRLLVVTVHTNVYNSFPVVTYNGVALIPVSGFFENTIRSIIYYLVNPPVGIHDIVVSYPTKTNRFATAISLKGVYQLSPLGNWAGDRDAGGPTRPVTIPCLNNNSIIVSGIITMASGLSVALGTSIGISTDGSQGGGYKLTPSSGNNTFTWQDNNSSDNFSHNVVEFKAAGEVLDITPVGADVGPGATLVYQGSVSIPIVSYQMLCYMKRSEYRIKFGGTFTIKHTAKAQAGGTIKTQIWKNGQPFGAEQTTVSTSNTTYTENLVFTTGDFIQLYVKIVGNINCYAGNLSVYADATYLNGIEIMLDR